MLDVLRGYLQVANGLGEITVQRARELAEVLASQGIQASSRSQEQVQTLTDELVESAQTNRDLLTGLVRTEVDRAVGRMGFVREEELAAVRSHVQRLEDQVRKEQQRAADRATGVVLGAADASTTAAKSAVAGASKTVTGAAGKVRDFAGSAEQAAEEILEAGEAAATATAKSTAKKAAATRSAAKKAPAKKTTAKKAPATAPEATPGGGAGDSAAPQT